LGLQDVDDAGAAAVLGAANSRDRLSGAIITNAKAAEPGGAPQALQPYLAMSPSTEHPDEPLDCSLPP
jgi:hypothetical protein